VKVIHQLDEWLALRTQLGQGSLGRASLGFVPTMGALHEGHFALLRRSVAENDLTALSIYVNPTQFNNPNDLDNYPDTLDSDLAAAEALGVDYVLLPKYEEIYSDDFRYEVKEKSFSTSLCGEHRPGHFDGVLTVVMKLLNIVRPDRAYFGEKDYQQYLLIRDMVAAFFMPVTIVGCPTVRESDGLALSSRNLNLDVCSRSKAPLIHELISSDRSDEEVITALTAAGFEVDYISTIEGRRFAAASLQTTEKGKVRLIDNVPLTKETGT